MRWQEIGRDKCDNQRQKTQRTASTIITSPTRHCTDFLSKCSTTIRTRSRRRLSQFAFSNSAPPQHRRRARDPHAPSMLPAWLKLSLPTIPLSLPSLPSNIERRLVSYLLKSSLGHFVTLDSFSDDQIDSQIASGSIEITSLAFKDDARPLPIDIPTLTPACTVGLESVSRSLSCQVPPWQDRKGCCKAAPAQHIHCPDIPRYL